MSETVNFIKKFESTVKECWDKPAIGEYNGKMLTYGEFAKEIEVLRFVCDACGLKKGDRIAINARNCYEWSLIFMAATTLGYTSVLILNGCTPLTVQEITNRSGCKILFTEKTTFAGMSFEAMPDLIGAVDLRTMKLLGARNNRIGLFILRDKLYNKTHGEGFHIKDVKYRERKMDDLCCVIYTSGSTGNPKGVMLTGQNFQNYVDRIPEMFDMKREYTHLNMLPFAHLFGLAYDILAPLCTGMTVSILCQLPTPSTLLKVLQDVRPSILFAVPMVLNKFMTKVIGPDINCPEGKEMLSNIEKYPEWAQMLRNKVLSAMGGNIVKIMSAGAAASLDMEEILSQKLHIPYVTGYGLTECAPLITLSTVELYRRGACGQVLPDVELKIMSDDPHNIPGELVVKSKFVFGGYYKNPKATKETFDENGWFRTGDVGIIDENGHVILSGRCKNMLLTSNGQNVYPE
ncbi:MAG: AMP-binding protein, partial [Bacteroidales bacterium]|nr:AMP-binding protein [Bacteroidales bacterium]